MSHAEASTTELTTSRQVELLAQLQELANRRAARETELQRNFDEAIAAIRHRGESETGQLQRDFEQAREQAQRESAHPDRADEPAIQGEGGGDAGRISADPGRDTERT